MSRIFTLILDSLELDMVQDAVSSYIDYFDGEDQTLPEFLALESVYSKIWDLRYGK